MTNSSPRSISLGGVIAALCLLVSSASAAPPRQMVDVGGHALQRDLATRNYLGTLRYAAQSRHNVHLDEPTLVARETTTMVDTRRRQP